MAIEYRMADDRDLSEVNIKDRSISSLRKRKLYALHSSSRDNYPARWAASLRSSIPRAEFLQSRYSRSHCMAVALTAWWQSIADAQKERKQAK